MKLCLSFDLIVLSLTLVYSQKIGSHFFLKKKDSNFDHKTIQVVNYLT